MHNFSFFLSLLFLKRQKREKERERERDVNSLTSTVASLSIGTYRHHLSLNTVQNVMSRKKSLKPMHKIIINFIWKKSRSSHKTVNKLLLLLGILHFTEWCVVWSASEGVGCISCKVRKYILFYKEGKNVRILFKNYECTMHACIIIIMTGIR